MAKPHDLNLEDWNTMVPSFHGESDRGAAVLAGGFVDNYLAGYLRSKVVDQKVAEDLFQSFGPLSTFSQRIAIARAFGFISEVEYDNLTLIRKIRNLFAHHPFDTSFGTQAIASFAGNLSTWTMVDASSVAEKK